MSNNGNESSTTCAAISTAHGKAGIAVVRMSGGGCLEIVKKVFFPAYLRDADFPDRKAVFGNIVCRGKIIDTGLCTFFRAPHSYTGEDVCEISCHGSILAAGLLLEALIDAGATAARPGEFTKRAFVNGKLDLLQSEAVGELIDAEDTASLVISAAKLSGELSGKLSEISTKITDMLASVYAYIDYPDEDLTDMSKDEMKTECERIGNELSRLVSSYDAGKSLFDGIKTAIVGETNTGKSSLLNMLLEKERAIVTDIAGTTRDVVTESVRLKNVKLMLSDTAGIRDTDDKIEKIGIEKSLESFDEAELVFCVFDGSKSLTDGEREIAEKVIARKDKKVVALINKTDIGAYEDEKADYLSSLGFGYILKISAKNNIGKELIEKTVSELYPLGDDEIRSGLVITNARVHSALSGAYEAVLRAQCALSGFSQDTAGFDLEDALKCLYEADGRAVSEKIVDSVFSHFCVGK